MKNRSKAKTLKWGWKPALKLQEILPLLPSSGWVLDLGCGCGGNSILLAKKGLKVVALDNKQEALNCLKERIKNLKIKRNFQLTKRNLDKRIWPKKKYSVILTLNILHFLSERRAKFLLRQMQKSLVPKGVVFIQIFSKKDRWSGDKYHPSLSDLKKEFREFQILQSRHYSVKDNHPPLGPHTHWIIDLIVQAKL